MTPSGTRDIRAITIHHTATGTGPELVDAIRRYHVEDRGWIDIAYHFLIDGAGGVHKGRALERDPDSHTDADFSGHVFVALLGNFEIEEPTAEQIKALGKALTALRWLYPEATVGKHCDHAETDCPGRHLIAVLDR